MAGVYAVNPACSRCVSSSWKWSRTWMGLQYAICSDRFWLDACAVMTPCSKRMSIVPSGPDDVVVNGATIAANTSSVSGVWAAGGCRKSLLWKWLMVRPSLARVYAVCGAPAGESRGGAGYSRREVLVWALSVFLFALASSVLYAHGERTRGRTRRGRDGSVGAEVDVWGVVEPGMCSCRVRRVASSHPASAGGACAARPRLSLIHI